MAIALPIALGSLSAALLLTSAVVFLVYLKYLRHKIGKSSSPGDSEKGLPTARVADGPEGKEDSAASAVVRRFSWEEIERMTEKFSSAVIGEGGFSTVYLARFPDSSLGALKIHRDSSERFHRAFKQELDVLLQLRHRNIVRLLGYCDERDGGVLVLEYVPNGSLHEKLHGCRDGVTGIPALPWANRMSIAFQVAKAVEHLHDSCSLQIVHCDIKASNVLLDDRLSCKLCDFGSAKVGFSATVLPQHSLPSAKSMMGSPGYLDPHYIRTGIVSKKSDVYSFGVLLLELITGVEAFCSEKEQLLTAVMAPVLSDSKMVPEMVDSIFAGDYNAEEAVAMAALVASCVGEQPSQRPSMGEISKIMSLELASSISAVGGESKGGEKEVIS